MELGFETIGNATLICHDRGPVLVTDPWIQGSAYFGSWKLSHHVPPAQMEAATHARYAWFSHGHPDHLNAEALPLLRGTTVLLPDHLGGRIRDDLQQQGFDVRVLADRTWTQLSPRIRVLCIADYNQDGILLVDVDGRLVVNLNDASDHGWGKLVRKTIKRYPVSFLLALNGFGDADMINFFDESGARIPLPPKVPLGQTVAQLCDFWGVRYFIPFSSLHRYQRTDSAWAAPLAAKPEDYYDGFASERCEMLPAFIQYDCIKDEVRRIDPPETENVLYEPQHFGDDWSEPLDAADRADLDRYFHSIEKLRDGLDFIDVRVGGQTHHIALGTRRARKPKGITLEAPRRSLMSAVRYEVFDDLLIGNFAKVTLHGAWNGPRPLYPEFTPYVAKYADNGRAKTRRELDEYIASYRRRDPLGHLQHVVELKYILPLQMASSTFIRGSLGPDSTIYRAAKKTYWYLRKAV